MAVRRTKSQKQKAQISRVRGLSYQYQPVKNTQKNPTKVLPEIEQKQIRQLMSSDPKDVIKDLAKTLLVTIIVISTLLAIFFIFK